MKEGARLSDSGTRNVFSVHESVLFSYITVMLGAHSYPRGSAPSLKLLTADNAPCYQDSSDNRILLSALVICTLSEADNAKFAKFNVI